ncbi:alpha/beta hydrolase, partial [Singulisphaera rosea]
TLPTIRERMIPRDARPDALVLFSPALNMAHDPYFQGLMKGKGNPARYSPSEFISGALPPTLILQGEEDSIVHTPDAVAFQAAAEKAGARCTLKIYPRVGHLLTRNLKVQYKDFDADPVAGADALRREEAFLASLGYLRE